MNRARRVLFVAAGIGPLVVASPALLPGVFAASTPAYTVNDVGPYGGEPSIVSDTTGRLYDATPSGGTRTFTSSEHGVTWTQVTTADTSSGDDCLVTDQSGAVYLCNLNGSAETVPLQADVWKSTDQGQHWTRGQAVARQASVCGTSCNPFGVDRDWLAASIPPPYSTTDHAEVVLMYHDFYGPSQIWVNISHDGGATFGPAQDVLTTSGSLGTLFAQGYSLCNTVPAGVTIAPQGTPHAGRISVAWIAADLIQNGSGCNYTMFQSFHTLWISYSDDNGLTWTTQQAFDAGIGHDASTLFAAFTIDNQGNPYFGFTVNLNSTAKCNVESLANKVSTDASCEYDMYVVWSSDGGSTWDGGGGTIPGSAARAYRVNPVSEVGTHMFPTIAAGDPAKVEVGYLRTPAVEPTDPFGKLYPGGCGAPTTKSPYAVGPCPWNLYAAQSLNLSAGPDAAIWTITPITTTPMHIGDICNLGIACVPTVSNRHLLDFNMETLDPQGCAHIAYADDNTVNKLLAANQTSGCIPNSGGRVCHEGDGSGTFHGDHGDGDFNFDSDGCVDGDRNGVDSQNRGDGKDFHATRIDSIALDALGNTETITGVGTSGGTAVSFVLVVVQSTALTPASVSLTLSDGFVNAGPLMSGSILLH